MHEEAKNPVKSVATAIEIVETLTELKSAPLHVIADEVDMYKSTVHNHLSTLREMEYVVKDGEEYSLSLQFLHVGGVLRNEVDLYEVAKSHVDQLAEDTAELATLATAERGLGIVLYRARGDEAVEIDTHVGSELSLHNSGLGKAIMAHLPREEVDAIIEERGLPAATANTITDRGTLEAEFQEIRDRGWALDDEENWRGLRCVAAPILTDTGTVKGAISLSAPKNRLASDDDREEYATAVKNAANLVELSITYS
jgi:DNA-binding IclR family transcriptional regulator